MGQEQSQTQTDGESHVKPRRKAKLDDIIVVAEKPDEPTNINVDDCIVKLSKLKVTQPLSRKYDRENPAKAALPYVNPNPYTEMLLRYQYHLTECAEAISSEQNAISKRMREIELFSLAVVKEATTRKRSMDTVISNLSKLPEMAHNLDRCQLSLDRASTLLKTLNSMLPEGERLPDLIL